MYIDLRSDTVTKPTEEMRKAMAYAEVGDDVYMDDPTVNKLEKLCADILGKEASLFVPSGTFANQLALFTHCQRGDEVIIGDNYHIVQHEAGAAAVIAGVQLRTVETKKGAMIPEVLESKIRKVEDIHYPRTGLICLENAHSNGNVIPLDNFKKIREIAGNIPIHLDGARLFNASTFLKVEPKEIAKYADSINICLSKGLCAPVGSLLVGNKEFIERARKKRKIMGGGMRQVGILAAAGIVALEKMRFRLEEDHENARYLAKRLSNFAFIEIVEKVEINMVFFKIDKNFSTNEFIEYLLKNNIKINPPEDGVFRFVTHYWIKREDIDYVVETMAKFFN
ncbi:threonine aldolase [Thermosipho affectus]|uniref:Threonine aldolase n=1 Tax=Thermosipho affectus TaxID=660294 RepID=A0ABX3IJ73_9BACT|nr:MULTISPECIES: low-specificity L-threonine aldolase [Thermosipho]ANQ53165.1 threonine aldolase [Thermosipho sp. 1070]APT71615.1 threonine aldolase [Thermosipho sp. 1063]ONN27869.1 threonine aldolase [Thermosipho affectus]OOC45688.1 threonine aldolase [Thermosipho sp. 1074]